MKTIEERAEAYYEGDIELLQTRGWLGRSDIADIVEKAYIQGATEQRKIDIEKACGWLENWAEDTEWYTIGENIKMLRKAMEE